MAVKSFVDKQVGGRGRNGGGCGVSCNGGNRKAGVAMEVEGAILVAREAMATATVSTSNEQAETKSRRMANCKL